MTNSNFIVWPDKLLEPQAIFTQQFSFSRTGGLSLNGIERVVSFDRGHWIVEFGPVGLYTPDQRKTWNAIRTKLQGRVNPIAMPIYNKDTAPYFNDVVTQPSLDGFSDGATFSDGSKYRTQSISVKITQTANISDTTVYLERINASTDLSGIRFSYLNALYETGPIISQINGVTRVPVFPAIRYKIPAGASLELDNPRCMMYLATDSEMDIDNNSSRLSTPTIRLKEAVQFWNDLATEETGG